MAMSAGQDDGEPIMDMNTTPLIDVMLVLLVMFIITIPIQTHAVKVDLPINDPNHVNPPVLPDVNTLSVDTRNQILWNGTPIDKVTLAGNLDQSKRLNPEPELHFQPDPYSQYNTIDEVLAVIKRSAITKMGFVGNEKYGNFEKK